MSKLGKKTIVLPKDSSIKGCWKFINFWPLGSKTVLYNEKIFTSKVNEKNEFQINPIKKLKMHLFYGEPIVV